MKLHGGEPFWPLQSGLVGVYPPLVQDEACDVLVVGAGITGALVASSFAQRGHRVIVIDRRDVASGSTSASTSLLQYEIDVPLTELRTTLGREPAGLAYRIGVDAIHSLFTAAASIDLPISRGRSLYVAGSPEDQDFMHTEAAARKEEGLDARHVRGDELRSRWNINAAAGIESSLCASMDPYLFTHGLLKLVCTAGGKVFDRTAVLRLTPDATGVTALTERGPHIRSRWAVLACGYETREFIPENIVSLHSTYALVTEPLLGGLPWPQGTLFWEHGPAYLYARQTLDGRFMIGGEDEPFKNAQLRDLLLADKTRAILDKFERFIPGLKLEPAFSWAGTFGRTEDGLGYIGPPVGHDRLLCALGFGGNGITFSAVAADLLPKLVEARERGRDLAGKDRDVAALFAFGRS
ncbi:MAG TPA: FAD-binding oxidoreductase [Phycisphaerales bacterium]|nr:FAD-binding oxidoreductase [Phycisphaerales bacterium]